VTLRPIVANLALLGGTLVTAFLVFEVSLRLIYPAPARFIYPQEAYDFDPELGHVLRQGQTAFTHDRLVQINSLGVRGAEVTPRPAPGTVRVLALGDSQTFGNGLDLSETWPKQLEQRLQAAPGSRWEVINAGVPGTDTWQHEILLRRLLAVVHPHAVVLALYVNDVVPSYSPRNADGTTLTNTSGKYLVYLLKRSAVVTWAYHMLMPWCARQVARGDSVEDAILSGGDDTRAERGWRQVETSLTQMKELCDSLGVEFLVAILPRRDQVSGQHPGRTYIQRARRITDAHRIETLDLLPSLSAEYRVHRDKLFIPWDGHNAAAANHVIAAGIATRLESLAAAPTAPAGPASPSAARTPEVQRSRLW
jgi:GDSL-like Lipase/Acylhydrolase family